jgi:hypothetical protein
MSHRQSHSRVSCRSCCAHVVAHNWMQHQRGGTLSTQFCSSSSGGSSSNVRRRCSSSSSSASDVSNDDCPLLPPHWSTFQPCCRFDSPCCDMAQFPMRVHRRVVLCIDTHSTGHWCMQPSHTAQQGSQLPQGEATARAPWQPCCASITTGRQPHLLTHHCLGSLLGQPQHGSGAADPGTTDCGTNSGSSSMF